VAKAKLARKEAKEREEKELRLLHQIDAEHKAIEKQEKLKNKVKIEAHGFDYETSFRREGSINPDAISEYQGFADFMMTQLEK